MCTWGRRGKGVKEREVRGVRGQVRVVGKREAEPVLMRRRIHVVVVVDERERERGVTLLGVGVCWFFCVFGNSKKKLSFFVLKTSSRVVIEWRMVKWGYWRREEGEDDTDIEEGKTRKRKRESLSKGLHKKRGYYTEGKYRGLYNSKLM